jgi:fermentation-respiration switch protein FrsA (DUF1100 family)
MESWVRETRAMPREEMSITSFDGLTLRGRYYEYAPGAPLEILFHGYRGHAERDLSGGVERCFALGRNALVVNHRASADSDGHVISFGINERRDCLRWVDAAIARFGPDVKIILTGISMGGATVLMAAGEPLPPNVVCVLADCPYSDPGDIIRKVIREMKLPARLLYPFVKLGARLYGRFDLEETSPLRAMKTCRVPVIFIHGDTDAFVPCEMSTQVYEVCPTKKKLVMIPGAGHGLAYPADKELYLRSLREFQQECGF